MGCDEQKLFSNEIFEILTRTCSLKTLDTCKCVSKSLNKLAYESTFMPLYCNRTNNLSGYFIQAIVREKKISVFVDRPENDERRGNKIKKFPIDMRILASCNQGLLCCLREKHRAYRFFVCKPATWQWQALPNPQLRYHTLSVAIIVLGSTPLRFKIVRLSHDQRPVKDYSIVRCEIFDSESWRWRATKIPDLSYRDIVTPSHPVVCVGSIHWLTYNNQVLVFHEASESFEKFPLPVTRDESSQQLVSYQGKLGLLCRNRQDSVMEFWILQDYNTYRWKIKRSVSFASLESTFRFIYPTGFYNAGIAFFKTWGEVVFYRLDDRSFRKVELCVDMGGNCEFFQFRSDLEMADLRGGRG